MEQGRESAASVEMVCIPPVKIHQFTNIYSLPYFWLLIIDIKGGKAMLDQTWTSYACQ